MKWLEKVKPSISVNWDVAKKSNILDADFYLADLLSENNESIKDSLFVLLKKNHYELNKKIDELGFESVLKTGFCDGQKAHAEFWNIYERPPKKQFWDYIIKRRDLLVPQDIREYKGSFFTPKQWVELSQKYLAEVLGEDWQDEYYIWDCCAGTGNLLSGLTNKYKIYASTLDKADVDVMKDRIKNGANILESHVFQFDFLNDSLDDPKLPESLRKILGDEEKRKKLVIYINPPYAEAATKKTMSGTGKNKDKVAKTKVCDMYATEMGPARNELFAQFLYRIYKQIPGCIIGNFSTLKLISAPNFARVRGNFKAKLEALFIVPSYTFDNVKGKFPIGFHIWDTSKHSLVSEILSDCYDKDSILIQKKRFFVPPVGKLLTDWLRKGMDKQGEPIAFLRMIGSDVQNTGGVFITNIPSANDIKKKLLCLITAKNLKHIAVYYAVRKCVESTWLNDRDQFLEPSDIYKDDVEFQNDCLAFALFSNNIKSESNSINHWIPFTEIEVNANELFESHFMTDYMSGKLGKNQQEDLLGYYFIPKEPLCFSHEAKKVFEAGRNLWRYYHQHKDANPNASLYEIKLYFQGINERTGKMNNKSEDEAYNGLIDELRMTSKHLEKKIERKVYEYGFIVK